MKKLRPVFLAVLTGCLCAYFLFSEVEKNTILDNTSNAVAIQIGVFKDEAAANNLREAKGGVVFHDDDLYRVYYSILNKDTNIDFVTKYLEKQGINYYLKPLNLDLKILDGSIKYEDNMMKASDEKKLVINKEILDIYKEVI